VSHHITFVQDAWIGSDVLTYPSDSENRGPLSGGAFFGGNVEFGSAVAPEPATFSLFGFGTLLAYVIRKRLQR
jgi:hypothetical protein